MPEFNLSDSIITSLNAQEPWPDNVKLYQPYEVEQILLPDNASCLAVQAFLKMCNLPFEVEMRWNAEFMSPSGRVPFIKCGAFVVSELEPIVQFAANKGVTLCAQLSTEEKAEMRAYMSLITNVLVNAELYISWLDNDTYNAVTRVRNSSVYPWPLGWLQTRQKRNAVAKRLKALHWHEKSLDQVLADVEQCCNSLSQRLGDKDFFFGTTPTPIDALVSGHVRALLSASGPKSTCIIKPITSTLLRHVVRVVNFTNMMLTPQEEYLITQAFQVTSRRLSPNRTASERSTRMKRSKMSILNPTRDPIQYSGRDVFGFKPFASKQIIILTSKGGDISFENSGRKSNNKLNIDKETYKYIIDLIDELFDKVDEAILDNYAETDLERNDFEIIAFPGDVVCIDTKVNDYLDTIDEIDNADTTISIDTEEILNDNDSDGLVVNKMLGQENVLGTFDNDFSQNENDQGVFESSSGSHNRITDSCSKCNSQSVAVSRGSEKTFKIPSKEEISVESLLKCLRERNAASSNYTIVDVD
ncbi:uncharacterized protein LOC101745843 isoform X2 [Bombyx mori]|uniref:Metaxin-2 n=1 Tax=Bombyx mori TaxID=7091 RepID=A0A8R2M1C8_BOMMO|nr:uncharacterized protein LOC101745843 isoform X2 [Bombyx mori]